jgi:hypothetical protein
MEGLHFCGMYKENGYCAGVSLWEALEQCAVSEGRRVWFGVRCDCGFGKLGRRSCLVVSITMIVVYTCTAEE